MKINSSNKPEADLIGLYWMIRIGLAFIWLWTAFVSWFIYPQAESNAWLRQIGLSYETPYWLLAACLADFSLGVATLLLPSKSLWLGQIVLITFYSIVITIGLPDFLFHPFGPVIKNIAVLACLYFLMIIETRR